MFTSYTGISSELSTRSPQTSSTRKLHLPLHLYALNAVYLMWVRMAFAVVAAISGAGAGAIQALAGAPAENVRLLMEQGSFNAQSSVSGWRHAWKEVFIDSNNQNVTSRNTIPARMRLSDVREAKIFANELREMAGRGVFPWLSHHVVQVLKIQTAGWNGWGWGLAKDVCGTFCLSFLSLYLAHCLSCTAVRISGFGLFFAIFDLSRRAAIHTSHAVESVVSGQTWTVRSILDSFDDYEHANKDDRNRAPTSARVAQGTVLVGGGGESSTSI